MEGAEEACDESDCPGEYVIILNVAVTCSSDLDSEESCELKGGQIVNVLETLKLDKVHRVRGRLENPPGWISLRRLDSETDHQWAMPRKQEDEYIRNVLTQGESFDSERLIWALRRAYDAVDFAHREVTKTWRTPLSLFDEVAEDEAAQGGVPPWAISCVRTARALVCEAAALHDLTDVYTAQIGVAKREERGIHRESLLTLFGKLENLAKRLAAHAPRLRNARAAFDGTPEGVEAASADQVLVELGSAGESGACIDNVGISEEVGRITILQSTSMMDLVSSASLGLWRSIAESASQKVSEGFPVTGNNSSPSDPAAIQEELAEERNSALSRVSSVHVRGGRLVDQIKILYSDGSEEQVGSGVGTEHEPFVLEEREFLVGVKGRHGLFLDAIGFITNRGRESPLYGNPEGGTFFELWASPTAQVWSLERKGGFWGKINRLVERPLWPAYARNAAIFGGGWWGAENAGDGPGKYSVLSNTIITSTSALDSEDVGVLTKGTCIVVKDVVHRQGEGRVRGRVEEPPGWISLRNTENGFRWAVKVGRTDQQLALPSHSAHSTEAERVPWNQVQGHPSAWLGMEVAAKESSRQAAQVALFFEPGSFTTRVLRCRRASERRWSMA